MKAWRRHFIFLLFFGTSVFASSQPQPPDLGKLEESVARQFNDIRQKSGLKTLKFRWDLRMRMEACAVETRGSDPKVEQPGTKYKIWYLTTDPAEPTTELSRLAHQRTDRHHVSVGVWFATKESYPDGAYWVVVYPEVNIVHEAFWTHFPLIDEGLLRQYFRQALEEATP